MELILMYRSFLFLLIFGFLCVLAMLDSPRIKKVSEPQKVINGKHWKTECKLIEINIDTGFFSGNGNRLDCAGIVENVKTHDYNTAVAAYTSSLTSK